MSHTRRLALTTVAADGPLCEEVKEGQSIKERVAQQIEDRFGRPGKFGVGKEEES